MRLLKETVDGFSERVAGRQMYCFGAGKELYRFFEEFRGYHLEGSIKKVVDNCREKCGVSRINSTVVSVIHTDQMLLEIEQDDVILITTAYFIEVAEQLKQYGQLDNTEVFICSQMWEEQCDRDREKVAVPSKLYTKSEVTIPKKIHYCWFGGNPIPAELRGCMDTWKRLCPDYEIVRWDESNYDVEKDFYTKRAYQEKRWGILTDFARLEILYQYGGIYFDTDVELIQNLDELLYQPAFCSVETWGTVGTGAGCGAQAGNPVIKAMLDFRKGTFSAEADGYCIWKASGYYDTIPLVEMGLRPDGTTQVLADGKMTVYSSEFFLPFNYISGETRCGKNTFAVHHYIGSWIGRQGVEERLRTRNNYNNFLKRLE